MTWLPPEFGGRPTFDHLTTASTRARADNFSVFGRQYFGRVLQWAPFLKVTVSKHNFRRESCCLQLPENILFTRRRNNRLCNV